jgi:hypothetical protein
VAAALICVLVGTAAVSERDEAGTALSQVAEFSGRVHRRDTDEGLTRLASRSLHVSRSETCRHARVGLRWYQKRAREWRERMGWVQSGHTDSSARRGQDGHWGSSPTKSCPQLRRAAEIARWLSWKARYRYMQWAERHERLKRDLYDKWRCIHEHEGAWNSNTGNGYYGGLQMDLGFQRSHGSEFLKRYGTADKWPVWAQLQAAERAYKTRGFGPWPTYWRYCA